LVTLGFGDEATAGEMAAGCDMELGAETHERQADNERLVGRRGRETDIATAFEDHVGAHDHSVERVGEPVRRGTVGNRIEGAPGVDRHYLEIGPMAQDHRRNAAPDGAGTQQADSPGWPFTGAT